ncbi:DUF397 domain-containing protein [Actinomadura syzygii]|uniref:DUF397 domain-containing protein n=1 Tax=Actinomadura syzygii TaxID=1427538 RepID=A0A5D0TTC6_9ACTN|nr:DUF397 domain-containing protein [Actinomadura syzygii]TYC09428.1 DUF397 domain-containing protein [Actinomadura syzygii]
MPASDVQWRKSSRSDQHGGECIEVANLASMVAVRDSKDPAGPKLAFDLASWRAFTRRLKSSEFDPNV